MQGAHTSIFIAVLSIVIAWCIWVTKSLFNQRQEIALSKQMLQMLIKRLGSN
jgi:hypothetical protein